MRVGERVHCSLISLAKMSTISGTSVFGNGRDDCVVAGNDGGSEVETYSALAMKAVMDNNLLILISHKQEAPFGEG